MDPKEYLATQILGADAVELVRMLYRGAIGAVEAARQNLQAGDIRARGQEISKALDFLSELTLSLNHEVGGEISQNLAELYGYIQQLVLNAHMHQTEAPLAEALQLLTTLQDGWNGVQIEGMPAHGAPKPGLPEVECPPVPAAIVSPYGGDPYVTAGRSWEL